MNSRPKSEDPIEFIHESHRLVPVNGYRWVNGESGLKVPRAGSFLVANPGGSRPAVAPPDFYLELAQLEVDDEATLAFAGRFGVLGLPREHFHSKECSNLFGESAPSWGLAISTFQFWFGMWRAAEDRDLKTLEKGLTDAEVPLNDSKTGPRLRKDLPKTAKSCVVEEVNRHLSAWTCVGARQGCFLDSCPFRNRRPPSQPPEYVKYQLRLMKTNGSFRGEGHLSSTSLLTTAWLQFAEAVCGQRKYRPCDVCGRLMDISEAARPGSKRMHDRCSLAERMRRYRAKIRNGNSEGEQ
jgi:hypothetical protein